MPPPMRKPQLPPGPHAEFVSLLFDLYRSASRPTTRAIAEQIRRRNSDPDRELPGTASHETIRRALRGQTIPTQWTTVEAIMIALCDLSRTVPESRFSNQDDFDDRTIYEQVREAWNDALDGPEPRPPQPAPWGDDEPPF